MAMSHFIIEFGDRLDDHRRKNICTAVNKFDYLSINSFSSGSLFFTASFEAFTFASLPT